MTGPGTNTYLLGTSSLAVVDPGPDDASHLDALVATAADRGARIRWVLVTHTHPDHAPGAAALAAMTGAELIGFDERDGFSPDRAVGDGWTLDAEDVTLRALHTPGHASNHLCWLVEGHGLLLSGDHVMEGSTVVIRPPDGDMITYLASLRRLLDLGPALRSIGPGHGRVIRDPAMAMESVIHHRLGRERAIWDALVTLGSATVDDLLGTVYADVDEEHRRVGRYSLWAHLNKLHTDGRVGRTEAEPFAAPADAPGAEPSAAPADEPGLRAVWYPAG
jgi:glyoxylase-like metal-dependent hydrolase (beta-lactamase superfamily II)